MSRRFFFPLFFWCQIFRLLLVRSITQGTSFIFLHVVTQFCHHHLLRRPPSPCEVLLAALSAISWACLWGLISGPSASLAGSLCPLVLQIPTQYAEEWGSLALCPITEGGRCPFMLRYGRNEGPKKIPLSWAALRRGDMGKAKLIFLPAPMHPNAVLCCFCSDGVLEHLCWTPGLKQRFSADCQRQGF